MIVKELLPASDAPSGKSSERMSKENEKAEAAEDGEKTADAADKKNSDIVCENDSEKSADGLRHSQRE